MACPWDGSWRCWPVPVVAWQQGLHHCPWRCSQEEHGVPWRLPWRTISVGRHGAAWCLSDEDRDDTGRHGPARAWAKLRDRDPSYPLSRWHPLPLSLHGARRCSATSPALCSAVPHGDEARTPLSLWPPRPLALNSGAPWCVMAMHGETWCACCPAERKTWVHMTCWSSVTHSRSDCCPLSLPLPDPRKVMTRTTFVCAPTVKCRHAACDGQAHVDMHDVRGEV